MKRLLLFAMGAMVSAASWAQEEDVTHYIQNAGFDEDLTWQADGSTKAIIKSSTKIGRSFAYEAADSSVYAHPDGTADGKPRTDVDPLSATNGFIGRIKGWTINSNQDYPKCEWVYFGSVPYDLGEHAIPVADNGTTFLAMPAKPAEVAGDDNKAALYLRAGWGAWATYSQVVNLPCAVYRLEYWAVNTNPSGTKGKNLSKVVCRKDTWEDETGFSDTEWTLHTIEFTPTSEFTMQFGFESEGGSGSNPFLCIDGIKLYKIGEADPLDLLKSDLQDYADECGELASTADSYGFVGLNETINDYGLMNIDEAMNAGTQEEMEAELKKVKAQVERFRQVVAEISNIDGTLNKIDNLLMTTSYPGKADLEAAYQKLLGYKENHSDEEQDVVAQLLGAVAEGQEAIKAYIMSQVDIATAENPADLTIFIQSPWFINASAEPTFADDVWTFPGNTVNEDGTNRYTEGSASSPDLNSTGWYVAGISGGDQRLNWQRDRSCWNAWHSGMTGRLAVAQDIEGLPNGYYTVSADMITQTDCNNGTQHVWAQSTAGKSVSEATLQNAGWDEYAWENVAMTAEEKVLVVDGKLTIGAEGTGDGTGSAGWFLATNFHIYYLGKGSADDVKAAFDTQVAATNELIGQIPFAGDKKALTDSIAKFQAYTDYAEGLTGVAATKAEAEKSIAKYEEYIPADGTVDGKTLPTIMNTLKENGGDGYGAAEDIVKYAYDATMNWVKNDTASYKDFDAQVNLVKNYLNTYTPAYNAAAETAQVSGAAGRTAIENLMAAQKAELTSEMKSGDIVNEFVAALNSVVALAKKQNLVDDATATDYTAFIMNPNAEAVDGWTFVMGNGDGNGEKSGQWLDGTATRYFDTYNSGGLKDFIMTQLITGLPNGTYTVGAYTRTPAEGAYLLYAPAADTTYVEIPLNYYQTFTAAGEDTTVVASDKFGPIWEAAKAAVESGDYTDEQYAIYNTNLVEGDPQGRGWKHQEMTGIVVTDHKLLIGSAAGSEALKTEKVFGGAWYSVGGWTLTLTALGDNSGWNGPVADGIVAVEAATVADGIYTLNGVKTNRLQRGLNIVISGGKAQKVLVK